MRPFSILGLVVVAAMAWFLGTDPLKLSPHGQGLIPDFKPQYNARVPSSTFKSFPFDKENKLKKAEIKWQGEVIGPESLAFDSQGRGPYTGVVDGRVLRYDGPEIGWTTFAYTSKNRSEACNLPGAPNMAVCGRPLGLRFRKETGELWIADAYMGIVKVGAEGGEAEAVVTEIDGVKMKFPNDLDFDDEGNLYFTDSSTRWHYMEFLVEFLEAPISGRLIKYNPITKETTVLLNNLQSANGVAVSKDGTFILLAETRAGRLSRYWLKGENAGTKEELPVQLPGWPDNIRRNDQGDFWVSMPIGRTKTDEFLRSNPWARTLLMRLPIPTELVFGMVAGKTTAMVVRLGPNGVDVKEVLQDPDVAFFTTVALEHEGKLFLGSAVKPHIAVYTLAS